MSIYSQFMVDENGKVTNIRVRSPHPKLSEEAKRAAKELPDMQPGTLNGNPARVIYTLLIILQNS